ncbi:hypothetical protein JX266_004540 [Neoarthrinium moseri]|nr:hypothetical protein JX266_004540 [Neoarthrinium moseri]
MAPHDGTILVTGTNGGLGTAIVKSIVGRSDLASLTGVYTVRDVASAASLNSALGSAKSHPHEVLSLDLSNLSSVRQTAAAINTKVLTREIPRLRAIILNAGYREAYGQKWNESGLDLAFVSNYLGHWLLVLLLLQSMDQQLGRVVVVGGWVHEQVFSSHTSPLDSANKLSGAFEDECWKTVFTDAKVDAIDAIAKGARSPSPDDPSQDPYGLSGIRRYGAAKLCSVMMIIKPEDSAELQRRLDSDPKLSGISVVGIDPGMMATTITTQTFGWPLRLLFTLVTAIASRFSPNGAIRSPSKSAGDVLAAALQTDPPYGQRPKGLYLNGSAPKEFSLEAKDAEKRTSLWKASTQYAALEAKETCLVSWAGMVILSASEDFNL